MYSPLNEVVKAHPKQTEDKTQELENAVGHKKNKKWFPICIALPPALL